MSQSADAVTWVARWIATDPATYPAACLPIFRKAFPVDKPVRRAIAHVCGLGHFELRVNGAKAGNDVLEPGWTDYRKTCLYVSHNVTKLLRDGHNAVGLLLGNGMYNVGGGRYRKFKGSFGPPKLICQLHIEFEDGASTTIASDATWRCSPGPITFSCTYGGEDHDARLEPAGWDREPFDDSRWPAVAVVDGPGGKLVPQTNPPSRVMQTFETRAVTRPAPGKRVHDLGQNFSGLPALRTRGPAGAKVTLITGELLDDAGFVNQKNTGKPVSFSYTLAGTGADETWSPRFSLTGFRYVQVETSDPDLPVEVTGQFIHAAAPVVGHFRCSNDLFNRTHALILAAVRSNMHSVLTDCPHREKLGWLEQTHLMGPSILYNFAARDLYRKVADDIRDAQHDDGCVPTIVPQYTHFEGQWDVFNDSPEWGSAAILNPWLLYRFYGDRETLARHYDVMTRYADYLASRGLPDGTIDYGLGDWYDIGPGDPGFSKLTAKALTATAIYHLDLTVLRRTADLLGKPDDAARFAERAAKVRAAFNARLFDPATGRYDRGSQTACAMPLALGLVDAEHRQAVLDQLVADVRAHANHLTAGDIGFHFVLRALAEAGRSDVVYDLLSQPDPPSYGSMLSAGATSLTEAWDANPKVSQNHFMLGHADAWFYEHLAGLRVDFTKPADEQITISPAVVGDVTWAEASYDSHLGKVETRWDRKGDEAHLTVKLPPDLPATVRMGRTTRVVRGPGPHAFSAPVPECTGA